MRKKTRQCVPNLVDNCLLVHVVGNDPKVLTMVEIKENYIINYYNYIYNHFIKAYKHINACKKDRRKQTSTTTFDRLIASSY